MDFDKVDQDNQYTPLWNIVIRRGRRATSLRPSLTTVRRWILTSRGAPLSRYIDLRGLLGAGERGMAAVSSTYVA